MYIAQAIIGMNLFGLVYFILFTDSKKILGSLGQGIMNVLFYK